MVPVNDVVVYDVKLVIVYDVRVAIEDEVVVVKVVVSIVVVVFEVYRMVVVTTCIGKVADDDWRSNVKAARTRSIFTAILSKVRGNW
jgi:hypothetical protein